MKVFNILLIIIISSCASIVNPDGGEKDTVGPKLKKTSINNFSTLVQDKKIIFIYNENITLKNKENVIINPNQTKYKIKINRNKLEIDFDTLLQNTTYSIDLNNSVVDINENNVSKDETYIFSTGKDLDTIEIKGKIINTLETNYNNCFAYLYENIKTDDEIDSIIWKQKPIYISKINDDGMYRFKSIKKNNYKILIIRDLNKNNILDGNEEMGFKKNDIIIENNTSIGDIYIYRDISIEKPQVNTFYCNEYGVFNFVVTPKNCKKKLIDNNLFTEEAYTLIFPGESADTITWFSPMANMQDGHFDLYLNDIYFMDLTTLHMNNTYIRRDIKFNNTNISSEKFNLFDTVKIRLSNPIYLFKKELVDLYIDSIKVKIDDGFYFLDNEMTKLRIKLDWKPGSKYMFVFKKGSFIDVYDQRIDSNIIEFNTEIEEKYSNLKIEIINNNNSRKLLQLVNSKNNIIRSEIIKESRVISFKQLLPDSYKIKIIEDINFNNEWDMGYYKDKIEPEKVYLYKDSILIKEGIDSENIKINIDEVPF